MLDLALILEPEEATEPLLRQVRQQMAQGVLPPRRLRVNRREVKQLYNNYQPKKRHLPRLSRLSRRSSFSTLSCCSTRSLLSPRQREEPQV